MVGGLRFIARCAAVLPALWLVRFLLALPFPGGHPSLLSLVLIVPINLSLTGRALSAVVGEPDTTALSLFVAVLGTVVELSFVGVVAGLVSTSWCSSAWWRSFQVGRPPSNCRQSHCPGRDG